MKFGAPLPTCAEGLGYPIGFASPDVLARIAERAETFGFYAVMANDHVSTPRSIREAFNEPPSFYEPLTTLAYCAARTQRIKLMTGAVVLPMREPVLLAKQVTTLDHCCDGRLILGVAPGAYREEFEAILPGLRHTSRASLLDEGVEALRILLGERRASFKGRYYAFDDVELYPKAKQPRLPLFIGGNTERAIRRTARHGDGWLPASLPIPKWPAARLVCAPMPRKPAATRPRSPWPPNWWCAWAGRSRRRRSASGPPRCTRSGRRWGCPGSRSRTFSAPI
jgi:probable F420-dependent oxidoreductase